MIYTCYEMLRDCQAGRTEGWEYFLSSYVQVIQRLLVHYAPGNPGILERILLSVCRPHSSVFRTGEPVPERQFIAGLRQAVLAAIEFRPPRVPLELESFARAIEPLTLVEKQAAWFETMGYGPSEAAAMLRMAPSTVEKIRNRAAELLRATVDSWGRDIVAENGISLGRAAAAASSADCLSAKVFLDVLDGRASWRGREEMERHAGQCLHCVDHFCRLAEVLELLRGIQPLSETEMEPFRKLLGLAAKRPAWKRWLGAS